MGKYSTNLLGKHAREVVDRPTRGYSRCVAAECQGKLPRKLRASRKQTRVDHRRWAAVAW